MEFSGDYNDLTNTPIIPTVPTNVSAFANDAGYLTGYTESDPQFNAWDKDYNDLINTPLIPAVPTNVSSFNNDAGYVTAIEVQQVANIPTEVSAFQNDAGYITSAQIPEQVNADWNATSGAAEILNKPTIPTVPSNVSAFSNDANYVSNAGCIGVNLCDLATNLAQMNALLDAMNNTIDSLRDRIEELETNLPVPQNSAPTVSTMAVSNITTTSAICGGNVTSDGDSMVTSRGVCWSTSQNPTVSGNHTSDGNGTGSFTSYITGLLTNTTYYVRAYATNSIGTAYGEQLSFTTVGIPSVTTNIVSNISATTVSCGGNVTSTGGMLVTARGVCWSTSPNPTVSGSHTTDSSGTGSFTSNITGLTANTMYYVRAYASNSLGTAYGNQVSFTTNAIAQGGQPCPGDPTVTDYDGNIYNTVQIGQQCWMAENLRTTHYSDGTAITPGSELSTTEAYYFTPGGSFEYGCLYTWKAVMRNSSSSQANPSGVQGICPTGWHVPSDAEWTQLETYVGGQDQYICSNNSSYIAKALASATVWHSGTEICAIGNTLSDNNATGFGALPAGYYYNTNVFSGTGHSAYFWSATEATSGLGWYRYLSYYDADVYRSSHSKFNSYSVRCLLDESGAVQLPTVTTFTMSDVAATTAISGGDVSADGGADVTARGVCWSTSQNPTVSDSHTSDGDGTGSFISTLVGLSPNTTYYLRAYAINSSGTAYGSQVVFITSAIAQSGQPCIGDSTVTDSDGNIYHTVQIGQQCWMAENLRSTKYSDGTQIVAGGDTSTTEAYYYIPTGNFDYGYLYNWRAVMRNSSSSQTIPSGVQGVCPTGWHVPSDAEWTQLTNFVSSQSDYICSNNTNYITKNLASTTGWHTSTNTCAIGNTQSSNNATGFSSLPSGYYSSAGYNNIGYGAYFWSVTESSSGSAWIRYLYHSNPNVYRYSSYKNYGYAVRCLRDGNGIVQLPTVTTATMSDAAVTTAISGGDVATDGGADVTARGVCWSTSQNPTVSDSHTTDGIGIGNFTSILTGLSPSTTYYMRAYATNISGTSYGSQMCFTTSAIPCTGVSTVTDYDGNIYNAVQIGQQCWMKENLRTTHYSDGTAITAGSGISPTVAYYYTPGGSLAYGYLYNWKAVMRNSNSSQNNPSGVKGICPTGWHVPSDDEWTQLETYVGGKSQYLCSNNSSYIAKALAATSDWGTYSGICDVGNNRSSNNATGFSALPVGYCSASGYHSASSSAFFWSATEASSGYAWFRHLGFNQAYVSRNSYTEDSGFSVRCLRNSGGGGGTSVTLPTVITDSVNGSTETSAFCGGNVTSDGGSTVTARGVCWSTSQNPTISNSHTNDGYGIGSFTSTLTDLSPNTTYYIRTYATNISGTTYGNQVSFTTSVIAQDGDPCTGTAIVTDYDGNTYNTVQIGHQCWMAENLRTTKYSDGTQISEGGSSNSSTVAYYYTPTGNFYYGYLYNWKAVMRNFSSSQTNPSGVQGICPTGWHVPSDAEWSILKNYLSCQGQYMCGMFSSYIAKALSDTSGWMPNSGICAIGNNQSVNNATHFSALPAGSYCGNYVDSGYCTYFWSTTEISSNSARCLWLHTNYATVESYSLNKSYGFSVRCLRD